MPPTPSSTPSLSWRTPALTGSVAVLALLVGGYVGSIYQKQADGAVVANKDALIVSTQQELAAQQEATKATSTPSAQVGPTPAKQPPPITIFSLPKGGDRPCRDDMLTLSWKADPSRLDEVRIWINSPFPSSPLADVPVSWNETGAIGEGSVNWKVGDAVVGITHMQIPDGELYRIHIDAFKNGVVVSKQDSGLFAIDTCTG